MTHVADAVAGLELPAGLRARPWRVADASALVDAWTTPSIAAWNPVPADPTLEVAERWIAGVQSQPLDGAAADVVITIADCVVGEVGLQVDRKRKLAEVGFWVAEEHRGQGIGASLLETAAHVASAMDVGLLVAISEVGNERALGLLESVGWREVETVTESDRAFVRHLAPSEGRAQ